MIVTPGAGDVSTQEYDENKITGEYSDAKLGKSSSNIGPKTSIFGCYVFLTKSMMGVGMLQLASVCAAYGWILGIVLCVFAALMTMVALMFNSQLARDHPGNTISFYTVSKHISPAMCWLIDIACVLDCFGASVGYVQTSGLMMSKSLLELTSWTISRTALSRYIELIMIACLGPFCFLRGISATAILSAIGLACIAYVCLIPLVFFEKQPGTVTPLWPESFMGSMAKLPVFFFAFSCMQNLFTVVNDIQTFTVKRVNAVCVSAVSTGLVVYLIVMIVPFAAYGTATQTIFLENYNPDAVAIQVSYIATVVQVSIGYVLAIHPTRQCVLSLWYRETEPEADRERKLRFIVTGILVFGTLGIALLTDNLDAVTAFTGLIGANTYCFTAPSYMFYLRYHPKHYLAYEAKHSSGLSANAGPPHRVLWYLSIACLLLSAFLYPVCLTAIVYEMVNGAS